MAIHVQRIKLMQIDSTGKVVDKNDRATTIKTMMTTGTEPRVMPDPLNANTNNSPTIEAYLILEDAVGYKLAHLDQTFVITQK